MIIKMEICQEGKGIMESYVVPDSSWIQTKAMGAQYAYPVVKAEITNANNLGTVICTPVDEIPEMPKELLRLVNSRDKKYGKNGFEWLGKNRECQGGTQIDRVREFVAKALTSSWHAPIEISQEKLMELREGL